MSPVWRPRLVKSAVGLALIFCVGLVPAHRLFQMSSVEAVINARLVTIRSPMDGIVASAPAPLREGAVVNGGTLLASLSNSRADTGRMEAAEERMEDLKAERLVKLTTLLEVLDQRAALSEQLEEFRKNRLRSLKSRLAGADARLASALALQAQSVADRKEMKKLGQKGPAMQAANRAVILAGAAVEEANTAKAIVELEANTLQGGIFYGETYNDDPRSVQRIGEIDLQTAILEAEISRLDASVVRADTALKREGDALARAQTAQIQSPVAGRIWQILSAPGELVATGQPLFNLLDCSRLTVSAVVSEADYNALNIGMPAVFTPSQGGAELNGQIVLLTGFAEASSNYAISPAALRAETYRVSVAIDSSKAGAGCGIGQTGQLVFQKPGV